MEPSNAHRKQLHIGLIALLLLVIHIGFSTFVFVAPERVTPRHKIVDVYRHLVVLGPFFTESGISHSHFFSVRYRKKNGTWSSRREFSKDRFSEYLRQPWDLDNLSYISYEKQLAHKVSTIASGKSFEDLARSAAFRELNDFLTHEVLPPKVDSVNIIYGLNYYHPSSKSLRSDTLFNHTYNPVTSVPAQE